MITWPAWLPAPRIDFSNEVNAGAMRTKMESGRVRQRPRFTRQLRTAKATFEMDDEQRAAFTSLWKYSLNNGTYWFKMNVPIEDGMIERVVRFIPKSYTEGYEPVNYWIISVSLEMDNQT
jgi:hypothetical protein